LRRSHFEAFGPICPRCRAQDDSFSKLTIAEVFKGNRSLVLEGVLHCSDASCQQEFPVIDGIPIIVPDVRLLLSTQTQQITTRSDLHHATQGMLGDASGDASEYNTRRQHLSIYGWDAYAEFDHAYEEPDTQPGALARCLETGLELLDGFEGPVLDLGCAVGRSTFELGARTGEPVLGIDLSFAMLQLAQQVLQTGRASFPGVRQAWSTKRWILQRLSMTRQTWTSGSAMRWRYRYRPGA